MIGERINSTQFKTVNHNDPPIWLIRHPAIGYSVVFLFLAIRAHQCGLI